MDEDWKRTDAVEVAGLEEDPTKMGGPRISEKQAQTRGK